MNKSEFKSVVFYYFLIILLSGLLLFNVYSISVSSDWSILFPIAIQLLLLILVFIKFSRIKLLLKIWSLIFLIIAPIMQLLGKLLKDASYDYQFFDIRIYIVPFIMLIMGIIVFYFTSVAIKTNGNI
ncbi:hypothetical protein [Chryseobacterium rhizosphaerae]|uniref:Uncharacterized protein n=1 Tax=Chryseobacterium rhizosphaerae TaxID=395937 RepID=A0ABX9IEF7_9FLAO|nr:hypothetical protein [Chryseobacterium rhizosphaerae]REC70379.1 hypothetical protein DRF57_22200 [Chryseobacterium rhizosphaerae]GEN69616.1 hypothetical protein CRH01_41840 [Chryseobacterium rhizosphaerae]